MWKRFKRVIKYLVSPKKYYKGIKLCSRVTEFMGYFIADRMSKTVDKGTIAVFSASSNVEDLRMERAKIKIFLTRENTHVEESSWQKWENCHLWNNAPTLCLGFDYENHTNYLRFPYWLEGVFGPYATKADISNFVNKHNISDSAQRKKKCAFICRKDYWGDRAKIADLVESVMPISYPSDFRHNDDDMRGKFKDDKIAYLRQFKFNLCPENTSNKGYVTEKIFEAIQADCVPIYWGNEGYPEPDILNPKAIVYLDVEHPEDGLALLRKLYEDPKAYEEFTAQPRFLPGAVDKIYAFYERLEKKISDIIG